MENWKVGRAEAEMLEAENRKMAEIREQKKQPIADLLRLLFSQTDYYYAAGGRITGKDLITIVDIMNNRLKGDYVIFENAGGKAFDVYVSDEANPNKVKEFIEVDSVKSWILATRVDEKEKIYRLVDHII